MTKINNPLDKRFLLAAVLALAPAAAMATVYRCTEAGKVVFSDRPCAESTTPVGTATGGKSGSADARATAGTPPKAQDERDAAQRSKQVPPCVDRMYNAWYAKQKSTPTREARESKLREVRDQCRKDAGLPPLR